jgi:hypothetical protein
MGVGWMTVGEETVAVGEGVQIFGEWTWVFACEQADTPSISKKYTEMRKDILEVVSCSFIAYQGGSIGLIRPGSLLPDTLSRSSLRNLVVIGARITGWRFTDRSRATRKPPSSQQKQWFPCSTLFVSIKRLEIRMIFVKHSYRFCKV